MNERGSVTFWLLGLSLLLMAVGGIGLDLWRALEVRRDLAATADAAAAAAVSAIDEAHWRETGEVRLDTSMARDRALASLASNNGVDRLSGPPALWIVDETGFYVGLGREVDLTLLKLLAGGRRLSVEAESIAYAVVRP